MRQLLVELVGALEHGRPVVHCSLVETRGSTPQKAGAAMLVFADGSMTGTLGGGSTEAAVRHQALATLNDPAAGPAVFTFDLDDDPGGDDRLTCGERITVLVAPFRGTPGPDGNGRAESEHTPLTYFRQFRQLAEAGRGCTDVIAWAENSYGLPIGTRYLFEETGRLAAQLAAVPPPAGLVSAVKPLVPRPKPYAQQGLSYLPVLPRVTLLVVGAGHVGRAVAALAATVEFDVWVLDDRESYASPEHFPAAQRLMVGDIGQTLRQMAGEIHAGVYGLVVTRGHNHDGEALFQLCQTGAGYLGMIGSRRKIRLIFDDLAARGVSREVLQRVHAPLGLPIGSQTVPEIAVSIVAELIACRNLGTDTPQRPDTTDRTREEHA